MADSTGSYIVKALKPRERRFVDEFFQDFQALPAAIRAGYSEKDTGIGTRLLSRPHIADEVRRRVIEQQSRMQIKADDLRRFHASIVWDPREPAQGGPTKTERIAAATQLGKLMGLYVERHLHSDASLEELLAAARDVKPSAPEPETLQ